MKLTGAQILCESLLQEGVEVIFGFPGGVLLPLYDTLPQYPDLRHILVRHEQGAAHAADGYARITGKVGVCLATSGPGATNLVTGIANAYMDSIPMVIFTGQVNTRLIGNDAFQEVDIMGITRPCTKHNYLIKDIRALARTVKEAFHIARSGRPGPVLVDPQHRAIGAIVALTASRHRMSSSPDVDADGHHRSAPSDAPGPRSSRSTSADGAITGRSAAGSRSPFTIRMPGAGHYSQRSSAVYPITGLPVGSTSSSTRNEDVYQPIAPPRLPATLCRHGGDDQTKPSIHGDSWRPDRRPRDNRA